MSFSALEILGFIVTLVSVWLVIKEKRSGWIWSAFSAVIYIFIYWKAKLYSDAELQLLYICISVYGYYTWHSGKNKAVPPIRMIGFPLFASYIMATLAAAAAWGSIHWWATDASLPYADALLATTCIMAQWMMARKHFQCWYLWLFANIGYIILYAVKGLPATTLLYIILLFFTSYGFLQWRKALDIGRQPLKDSFPNLEKV